MTYKTKNKDAEAGIVRLNVRIEKVVYEALQEEAQAEMLPVAAVVRRVLREHVRGHLGLNQNNPNSTDTSVSTNRED